MRRCSNRFLSRAEAAKPIREALVARRPECWVCGHSPRWPWRDKPKECSQLCVHEILNGPLRQKCLDKVHSLLVTCWFCNSHELTNKRKWPEARQLAVLLKCAPENYDLAAHNFLANPRAPNRITEADVAEWMGRQ
jgi:hypothetical protein